MTTGHWSSFDLPGRALGKAEATGYARACWPAGTDTEIEFLAIQIATMTALDDAFDAVTATVNATDIAALIPWTPNTPRELSQEWRGMRAALAWLDAHLPRLTPGGARRRHAVQAWWRRMAEQQIKAFAQESAWRINATVPHLRTYVQVGQQSIGVEWTAATLVALDSGAQAPQPGTPLGKVIDAIARAIRMANDLHDPERERLEGKVQWVLLRSRELVALDALQPAQAEAVAARELQVLTRCEAESARSILRDPAVGANSLRTGLEGLLAVGLATYVPDLVRAI